jgi:hypothetical protein
MKRFFSLFLFSCILLSPLANATENHAYKKGNYAEVISKLEPNVENLNSRQALRLAHSYYKMKNYFKSKILYYQVAKKKKLSDVHKMALADILLSTNMLELSQKMLASCENKNTAEFTRILNKINWSISNEKSYSLGKIEKFEALEMSEKTNFFSFHNKVISNIQLDRKNTVSSNSFANFTNMPELNFTISAPTGDKNENILIRNPFFTTSKNTLFHSVPVKINERKNRNKKGNKSLIIVRSIIKNGQILEGERLTFCKTGHNYISPFLFENKLYFSSDQPGGFGGYDLYVSELNENNQWSEPRNLGNRVNGPSNEMYPTIIDGQLFFSSDGHNGFGGTDIFKSFHDGIGFGTPVNLGKGINSGYDDYSLIKTENETYFFITNRDNLKGYDEVYTTDKIENFSNPESLTSRH